MLTSRSGLQHPLQVYRPIRTWDFRFALALPIPGVCRTKGGSGGMESGPTSCNWC